MILELHQRQCEDSTADLPDSTKKIYDSTLEETHPEDNRVYLNMLASYGEQRIHDLDSYSRLSSSGLSFYLQAWEDYSKEV